MGSLKYRIQVWVALAFLTPRFSRVKVTVTRPSAYVAETAFIFRSARGGPGLASAAETGQATSSRARTTRADRLTMGGTYLLAGRSQGPAAWSDDPVRVAVFMGSSPGTARHRETAVALAEGLVGRGIGIVYGGARVGLMGVLADAALAAGGEVVGVIPRDLFEVEVPHRGLTELVEVDSMHARKARMAELADAFVALPGGIGTLEELFEVFTWQLLGIHDKPVLLLDPDGFYDPLVEQLDRIVAQGYLSAAKRAALARVGSVEELLVELG